MAVAGVTTMKAGIRTAPTKKTVNIGIIGTGSRGGGLMPIINEIDGLEVTACCDVIPFRLQNAMKKVSDKAKAYTDYRALLNDKNVDAVLIAAPFSEHSQMALDALDAQKHVYCEKTMVKGYDAIKKLIHKASASPMHFQTGHQYHSSRLYTHVVDLIQNGKIGKISAIVCQWNRNGDWRRPVPSPEWERAINWRMYREYSGGLVAELCSHQLDFCNWLLNAVPHKVYGNGGIDYWKDGRETFDNVHLIYSYPKGVRATFTCLTSNAKDDYKIKVLGDKGTLTVDYAKAWYYPEKSESTKKMGDLDGVSGATVQWEQNKGIPIPLEHLDPSKQALLDFRDSIWNDQSPKSNVISGAKAAICVQMGLDSLYSGNVVHWKDHGLSI